MTQLSLVERSELKSESFDSGLRRHQFRPSQEAYEYQQFASEVRRLCGRRDELLGSLAHALETPDRLDDTTALDAIRDFTSCVEQSLQPQLVGAEFQTTGSTLMMAFHAKLWSELKVLQLSFCKGYSRQFAQGLSKVCALINDTASQVLTESLVSGLRIVEHDAQNELTIFRYASILESINSKLTIQREQLSPQEGFGRTIKTEEMRDLLSNAGAKLFTLELGGSVVGYYLVFLASRCSPEVKESLSRCKDNGLHFHEESAAWGYIVGITNEARALCSGVGANAYDLLHTAMLDSMRSLEISNLYAEVREGEQANLAKSKHLRRGWKETGIVSQHGEIPYQLLELQVPALDQLSFPLGLKASA